MDQSSILILIILIIPWVFLFFSRQNNRKLAKNNLDLEKNLSDSAKELAKLKDKYSPITNIENHAKSLKVQAVRIAQEIEYEANKALTEAKNIRIAANKIKASATEKAASIKEESRIEAKRVLTYARQQATEIAGSAYEAKEKAETYEKAILAMRNTIEGYREDYIIPNNSVIDDLAEDFSHKDAGEKLKLARKRTRELVKSNLAGMCDYAENNRRTYAIHFAVDAFNGKVDSALSKTKSDNYGKIKQEILDAYALVNHNGSPFRNARITQEYLDSRLEELTWTVAAIELRNLEKQEQAEIKARIREEERAIREIEKARKEAEKEERMLQKALAIARKELDSASTDQKAKYEAQLAELEVKLHEAEERGQRALSMAQQTRRGHVYVISNIGSFGEQIFKIGMTRRLEPLDRVKELGDASVPFSFDIHAMIYSDDAPRLEKLLHEKFSYQAVNKVNPRKEFFKASVSEIKQAVELTENKKVHWTLKAEAAEYRESLAIENEQSAAVVA